MYLAGVKEKDFGRMGIIMTTKRYSIMRTTHATLIHFEPVTSRSMAALIRIELKTHSVYG